MGKCAVCGMRIRKPIPTRMFNAQSHLVVSVVTEEGVLNLCHKDLRDLLLEYIKKL